MYLKSDCDIISINQIAQSDEMEDFIGCPVYGSSVSGTRSIPPELIIIILEEFYTEYWKERRKIVA